MRKTIALNERGRRIGESHPRAKLLDYEVEQVLALLDAGLSYAEVARKFDVGKSCVAHIAAGQFRFQAGCLVDNLTLDDPRVKIRVRVKVAMQGSRLNGFDLSARPFKEES